MSFNSNYFKQTNNIFNLKLKPNQFTILSYLIRMSNEAENCYPSMNNISEMCCVSKSTVVKTIEELEQAGYITVNIDNTYNIYTINYDVIESTNNRPEKVKRTRIKKESATKKAEEVKEVEVKEMTGEEAFNPNITLTKKQVNDYLNKNQVSMDLEKDIQKVIEATGVTSEEATKELNITKSKDDIKNVVQYTIGTIRNKQADKTPVNTTKETNDNMDKLEAMLLGYESFSDDELSEVLKVGNGNYISNNKKRFKS